MARTKKVDLSDLVKMRKARNENQSEFWQRFGCTQSGGSRYEGGRDLPRPTAILIALYELGVITDEDLEAARKAGGIA